MTDCRTPILNALESGPKTTPVLAELFVTDCIGHLSARNKAYHHLHKMMEDGKIICIREVGKPNTWMLNREG
jgi:hypothetical protein